MLRPSSFAALLAAACLLAGAAGARAACTGFGAPLAWVAGASPQQVVAADFDGDGVLDLAFANLSGAALTVMHGAADGTFAAPVSYATGAAGRGLAVSDFNGDGVPDIAVAVGDGVAIWLGAGNGTFAPAGEVIAGSANRAVACADFDGDGIVDLAVASSSTNAVIILHGNGSNGAGDGTFTVANSFAVGTSPARLAVADLDGDGVLDLVVANNGSASVSVLRGHATLGRPDGTFLAAGTYALGGSPWAVAVLDWNRDGLADLVVSDGAGTTLALLRGTGGGAFALAGTVAVPAAPRDLVVGDFDGDGIADVATACAAANLLGVLHGTGSGFTTLGSFACAPGASGIVAGDWNGDGTPDVAVACTSAGSVWRLLGTCPPAPGSGVTLLAPLGGDAWWPGTVQTVRWQRSGGVTAVDVDLSRDGGATWTPLAHATTADSLHVPATGTPGGHLRVRVRDTLVPARAAASAGDFTLCGVFGDALDSATPFVPAFLASAALDADSRLDLVACDATDAVVLRGDGTGHFVAGTPFATDSTRALALADLDGDGRADLVRLTPAGLAWRAGDGNGGFGAEQRSALAGGVALACGDFDADGVADVAVLSASAAGSQLVVYRSSAPGTPWSVALDGTPAALATADFDGDGILDLALACGGQLQLWTGGGSAGRGDGTFAPGAMRALPSPAGDVTCADLDGDGVPDVLACLPASGDLVQLGALAPNGATTGASLAPPSALAAGTAPGRPLVADFDGDGHADVALVLGGDHALAVFLQRDAGFAPALRFASGTCGGAFVAGDFDGDGNPDVVLAGTDASVHCLRAECPPELAATLALATRDTSAATLGFTRTLAWQRSPAVGAVRVELSRDGGAHWTTLADAVTGNAFAWSVSGTPAAAARLRVSDATCGTRVDTSPVFAIRAPLGATRASALPAGGTLLACADVDGDGVLDAAVADSAAVHVLRGDGAGGFVPLADLAETGVRAVRIADLDADGRPDLLTLHANGIVVRRGLAGGAFAPAQLLPIQGISNDLAVADVDADGLPDLAIASDDPTSPRIVVLFGRGLARDGSFAFAYPSQVPLPGHPVALAIGDVDGDGAPDLVIAEHGALDVELGIAANGFGTGGFRLASRRAFGADVRALSLGDFAGAGRIDVAAADLATHALLVAAGDGSGGFGSPATLALPAAPAGAALAADVDRDGSADFLLPLAGGDVAFVRSVPGAAFANRFALAARIPGAGAGGSLAWLDADGDGVPDLIALDPGGALRVRHGGACAAGAPQLTASPGSALRVGSTTTIAWSRPRGVTAVNVELSRDGGTRWTTLASGLTGSTWRWFVSGMPTGLAWLRVRDAAVPAGADSSGAHFVIEPSTTGVTAALPTVAGLRLASANPARTGTTLALALPHATPVRIDVCDVSGRLVRTLADGAWAAGAFTLRWDGRDAGGVAAPPGLYFVRARAGEFTGIARVVLAR